ncbi:MAG: response regulator [Deltaproteobacteria bacterium]|nr:MAG: response regulator [Deltaproteobacteria bacterium]
MEKRERALVVDDEDIVCQSVQKILNKKNFETDTALSAKEALDKIEKKDYGVVITDLMMPKVTGMQLLETIKKEKPYISVIMITGYATIRTAVQAIKLGAFDYIPKPFTPEELSSVTLRAMERTRIYYEEERGKEKLPPMVEGKGVPVIKSKVAIEFREEEKKEEDLLFEGELYCIPEHSWARVEKDGNVRVGMEDMFKRTAGEIINIDLPFEGDEVRQGNVCVHVTSNDLHIHKLWSPVTGKIIEVNESVNRNCSLVNKDPRGRGWFIRIKPTNLKKDLENLAIIKSIKRWDG